MEFNFYEYSASQKAEGKWIAYKILLISLYVAYVIAFGVIIYVTAFIPVGALIPVTLWILVFFTYKYTSPDYKYVIEHGQMAFYKTYGKKTKKICEFRLKDIIFVKPSAVAKDEIKELVPKKSFSAVPYSACPDIYAAVYKNGEDIFVFYFRATREALKVISHYKKDTVVICDTEL